MANIDGFSTNNKSCTVEGQRWPIDSDNPRESELISLNQSPRNRALIGTALATPSTATSMPMTSLFNCHPLAGRICQ